MVGRTPWAAAAALVGLPQWRKRLILRAKSGTRASRADQGVRPTNPAAFHLIAQGCVRHESSEAEADIAGDGEPAVAAIPRVGQDDTRRGAGPEAVAAIECDGGAGGKVAAPAAVAPKLSERAVRVADRVPLV